MRFVRFFFCALTLLFSGTWQAALAAEEVLLPLPFENLAARSEYQWISESFAIMFSDLLDTPGLTVLTPEERVMAYERIGMRRGDLLTRATEIRVTEAAQANLALVGNYDISTDNKSATIAITAWLIDTREGRKKPFNFSGPLADLQTMQGLLAWSILYERDPALPYSQEQFKRRAKLIPPKAYEYFVKGIQTSEQKSRDIFLKRAIKEFNEAESVGHYAQAIFELGWLKYRQKEYAEAVRNFKELVKDDPHYQESRFYLGLAANALNQPNDAIEAFDKLATALPMIEVLNNAGALLVAKGDLSRALLHLQRAAAAAQKDAVVRFNYGYALWKNKNYDAAANEFRAVIASNPKDGEAQYLLAKSLTATDRKIEAEQADQEARRNLASYAKWEVAPDKIPSLIRLKNDFNRAAFYKLSRRSAAATNLPPAQARLALQGLDRAKQLLAEKNDGEALTELQKVLTNDPTLAEAHFLRAQILQRRNDTEGALSAYAAAIYWNPRLGPAHVSLGQIYLTRGDRVRALSHSKLAIEIDPQNREAMMLKRQIEGGR